MTRFLTIAIGLFVGLCQTADSASAAEQPSLRAGAAAVDITPQPGVSLDGFASRQGPVLGVHDPLHARALVLDDGKTKLAIVVVDLCAVHRDVFDAAKTIIEHKSGLPADQVLIAATHTHSAPRLIHRDKFDAPYYKEVSHKIARAVIQARKNLAPARLGYASFNKPEFLACRRFLCEPGTVSANPFGETGERVKSVSSRSRHIIKPAGPIDPQFSILSVQHADGTPLAVLGNYSVHYGEYNTNGIVSADYFGHYAAALEEKLDAGSDHPPFVGIMSNGTSGDTAKLKNTTGKKYPRYGWMKAAAGLLAEETLQAMESIEYRDDITLAMRQSELELAVRHPDEERLEWARGLLKKPKAQFPNRLSGTYARQTLRLAEYPKTTSIQLQAICIGDVAIAAIPCEVFAQTGLKIKAKSPISQTFTMELANGWGGYLPSPRQHELGGFETWMGQASFLETEAEPKIVADVLLLLEEVAQEKDISKNP